MLFQKHSYLKKPPPGGGTRLAQSVDFGLFLLLIWLITILFFQVLIPVSKATGPALIFVLVLETILVIKYKLHRQKKINKHRDIWFSARKCREQLYNTSRHEFINIAKDLLASTGVFKKLHIISPEEGPGLNIGGFVRGEKVGIMCINNGQEDDAVTADQVEKFLHDMGPLGFSKGIILTTGCFSSEARRFVQRNVSATAIGLWDGDALIRIAQKAKHPIFPNEKWREEQDGISSRELALWVKNSVLSSRAKILMFIALGLVFLAFSTFQTGFSSSIYLIFGIINLFIGFLSLALFYLQQKDTIF